MLYEITLTDSCKIENIYVVSASLHEVMYLIFTSTDHIMCQIKALKTSTWGKLIPWDEIVKSHSQ